MRAGATPLTTPGREAPSPASRGRAPTRRKYRRPYPSPLARSLTKRCGCTFLVATPVAVEMRSLKVARVFSKVSVRHQRPPVIQGPRVDIWVPQHVVNGLATQPTRPLLLLTQITEESFEFAVAAGCSSGMLGHNTPGHDDGPTLSVRPFGYKSSVVLSVRHDARTCVRVLGSACHSVS